MTIIPGKWNSVRLPKYILINDYMTAGELIDVESSLHMSISIPVENFDQIEGSNITVQLQDQTVQYLFHINYDIQWKII